ncbi:MAG: hypothetical protein GXX85_11290 [Ignavibacteria bacterium]|nr:hypothetical protein [Ignavibacteria bacterium]
MKPFRLLLTLFVLVILTQTTFAGRYYDSETGRWLAVDPMADKYPGWSPYNYCANNPLIFVDPNGMDVYAKSDDEKNMIINTLSEEERKYVQFDENGLLNKDLLNQYSDGGGNFNALLSLAGSSDIFEVMITDEISISGKTFDFGDITIDDSFEGGYASLSTNETGWTGQTITKDESNDGHVQITINKNLTAAGRAETFSHEGYGHAYFMSVGKNPDHIYLKTDQPFIFKEGNTELKKQIIERILETRKNMGN